MMRHSLECENCPGDGLVWLEELGFAENCSCMDSPPGEECHECQLVST